MANEWPMSSKRKETNMKRELFIAALSAALATGLGSGARADDRQQLDATVSTLNQMEVKHGDHDALYARIAAETGVSVETLRKERTDTGMGFGSLLIANELAKASGRSFAEVAAEFKAGKGWGQIAAEANVKLGALMKAAHRVETKVESDRRDLEKRMAREKQDLDKKVVALDAAAKHGEDVVYARISAETGVAIETLRKEKAESGLGFGGLLIATELSQASGKSFADVVAEFKAGKGWGEIAVESNLKLGKMISSAAQVNTAVEHDHGKLAAQGNANAEVQQGGNRASGNVSASGAINRATPLRTPPAPALPVGHRR